MSLKRDVRANYLGQGWTALMGLAFIPIYIRYLGIEAWGLVGFMSMLQAWLTLLDMGLAPTLSREMARFGAGARSVQSIRNLLRSLELLYVAVALAVVLGVWSAAPLIVDHWLNPGRFGRSVLVQAIALMGLVLAARMVEQVYRGAMQGLQQHVWLNLAQSVLATLRWGGAVVVLAWASPTIEAFFIWQGLVSVLSVLVFAARTYRRLPSAAHGACFDALELKRVGRFAAGMAATTVLALLLTQVDKLLLSKLLPLDQFGHYMLAGSLSGALYFFVGPLATAVSPRLTELAARSEHGTLIETYHSATQWVTMFVLPPALVMAMFAEPLLWAWSGDVVISQRTAPLLTLLALGTLLNGLMQVPYVTQLAHGWTALTVRMNSLAVLLLIPGVLWSVPRYGAMGAAWAWLALNAAYVFVGMHFMFRELLATEKRRWYRDAVVFPLIAASALSGMLRLVWPVPSERIPIALWLLAATAFTALGVALATPAPRAFLCRQVQRLRVGAAHG